MKKLFSLLPLLILIAVGCNTSQSITTNLQSNSQVGEVTPTPTTIATPVPTQIQNIPAGWESYTSTKDGIEVNYPPSWKATDISMSNQSGASSYYLQADQFCVKQLVSNGCDIIVNIYHLPIDQVQQAVTKGTVHQTVNMNSVTFANTTWNKLKFVNNYTDSSGQHTAVSYDYLTADAAGTTYEINYYGGTLPLSASDQAWLNTEDSIVQNFVILP